MTLEDVAAAHAAWVDAAYGTLVSLDDLAGRKVVTEMAGTASAPGPPGLAPRRRATSSEPAEPGLDGWEAEGGSTVRECSPAPVHSRIGER